MYQFTTVVSSSDDTSSAGISWGVSLSRLDLGFGFGCSSSLHETSHNHCKVDVTAAVASTCTRLEKLSKISRNHNTKACVTNRSGWNHKMQVSYSGSLHHALYCIIVSYPREWSLSKQSRRMPNKTMDMLKGLFTIREYQNFLEEGKLPVDGASVASTVSHHYPDFWHHEGIV